MKTTTRTSQPCSHKRPVTGQAHGEITLSVDSESLEQRDEALWRTGSMSQPQPRTDPAPAKRNEVSEEQLAQAVQKSEPAIRSILGPALREDWADVLQETYISAAHALPRFDGASLQAWVNTIARRRAYDHISSASRRKKHQDHFEVASVGRTQSAVSLIAEDFSEHIDDRLDAAAQLAGVIDQVEAFIQNQATSHRALELITTFGDDVETAARAMVISEDALRACRREFVRCAIVVAKATGCRDQGLKPTMGVLIECMPAGGESGEWVAEFVQQVLASGGFGNVDLQRLMIRTGLSYNTVRQYLKEAKWLMQIAATVLSQPPYNNKP
ncbi:RNA polymerase sigma factor [Glutamicibacter uratoxydans]|uniref:RNA polymerase sigma factor n=1 Tax=Glutamicibacter uratoxydans TaxID=43667 RepID=UPI003D6F7F8D